MVWVHYQVPISSSAHLHVVFMETDVRRVPSHLNIGHHVRSLQLCSNRQERHQSWDVVLDGADPK